MFKCYYVRLIKLKFKRLCPQLVTARIIKPRDEEIIRKTKDDSKVASRILDNIQRSLASDTQLFEAFLTVLKEDDDLCLNELADDMRREISENTTGTII